MVTTLTWFNSLFYEINQLKYNSEIKNIHNVYNFTASFNVSRTFKSSIFRIVIDISLNDPYYIIQKPSENNFTAGLSIRPPPMNSASPFLLPPSPPNITTPLGGGLSRGKRWFMWSYPSPPKVVVWPAADFPQS